MKRVFIMVAALMMSASIWAQSPEKMSYQAVVRDANNVLVTSQPVGMQISILQGGASGTSVYVETQTQSTNINGLVSLEIGTGTNVSGDFTTIDWANDTYFIQTETDPTGGSTYTITGTSQLMSVPYALYAKTSGSSTPGPTGPQGLQGNDGAANISGTTNHLVKFTNASTGGDSKVYDDGTNVGVNTTNPQSVLDVNGILTVRKVSGTSISTIQTNENDAKMILKTNRSTSSNIAFEFADGADTPLMQIRDDGRIGIGTIPSAQLDIAGNIKITDGTEGSGKVLTSDASGLATWTTPTTGGITAVTAGTGLTGGGTAGALTLNAVGANGLTATANDLKLGGTLSETTSITQGNFGLNFDLTGTGDFNVRDNGVFHFQIKDDGTTNIGGTTTWMETSVFGTTIAELTADGDDGRLAIMENGIESIKLDANGTAIFNEQGLDRDFRVESVGSVNMLRVDAGNNRVGIGMSNPTSMLEVAGDIELDGGLQAPAAAETLKMLRGTFNAAGQLVLGQGMSATNPATGVYDITFVSGFTNLPTATVGAYSTSNFNAVIAVLSTTTAQVRIYNGNNGALTNLSFNLTVMGPR